MTSKSEPQLAQPAPLHLVICEPSVIVRQSLTRIFSGFMTAEAPPLLTSEAHATPSKIPADCAASVIFIGVNPRGVDRFDPIRKVRASHPAAILVTIADDIDNEGFKILKDLKVYDMISKTAGPAEVAPVLANLRRMQQPISVLIIDDSASVRAVIIKILSQSQFTYTPQMADGAEAALLALAEGSFDVILLDFNMPGMNGAELLPRLRQLAPDTPVILSTSVAKSKAFQKINRQMISGYLSKPFFPKDLDRAIRQALGLAEPNMDGFLSKFDPNILLL